MAFMMNVCKGYLSYSHYILLRVPRQAGEGEYETELEIRMEEIGEGNAETNNILIEVITPEILCCFIQENMDCSMDSARGIVEDPMVVDYGKPLSRTEEWKDQ
jgi:hypothetical protein